MTVTVHQRSPRVPLPGRVTLDDGQRQVVCEGGNLSRSGLLVHPPGMQSLGRFVRVWLCLPGREEHMELSAFQVREGCESGRCGWGLRFIGSLAAGQAQIDAFVDSVLQPGETEGSAPTR